MSLESCIKKAGMALTKEDAAAIRVIRDDIVKGGRDHLQGELSPNEQAVAEYLDILELERDFIMRQVNAVGGALADPNLSPSNFAKQAAKNLEDATRRFPRKGILRPATETKVIDAKTGERIQDTPENRRVAVLNMSDRPHLVDPLMRVLDLSTERTHKTIEYLYPDFYTLPVDQVLAIVAKFDETAALGLAKHFGILPREARKLIPANYNVFRMKQIHKSIGGPTEVMEIESPDLGEVTVPVSPDADWFYGWAGEVVGDWIQKNETLPLYFKVESVAERDMVENNPDNPLSVTIKYAQIVQEAEEAPPFGIRKGLAWLRDTLGIKGALGAVPQTKLGDFVQHGMESVPEYTKTIKLMDAWMNGEMEGHHNLATRWLKFNKAFKDGAKLLGEFMHASTLAGVDVISFAMPDAATYKKMSKKKRKLWDKKELDYRRLAPFWAKLAKHGEQVEYQRKVYDIKTERQVDAGKPIMVSEAQLIYLQVRDTYSVARDMMIHRLEVRILETEATHAAKATLIAKLRKQFEVGTITPYFPLARFGRFHAVAKTADGETVAFIKRENARDRNRWMNEMRAEGFAVTPFEEKLTDIEQMNKVDPGFVTSVVGLLEESTIITDDPETGQPKMTPGTQIQDEIWQLYLRTLPEMSARKAYVHRIGRLGFTGDALRSFADHTFHTTHQMAKLKYGVYLSMILKGIEDDATIVMQRASGIKNMRELGWRPETFEGADIHDVMFDTTLGGQRYRDLFKKFTDKEMSKEEASEKATDQILEESEHDQAWATPLANEMKRRHAYNMNPKSAAWSTKMTAFGFLWFLSSSPAAGFLNLTQTPVSAYPILRAEFSGQGAGMELLKAARNYTGQKWLGWDKEGIHRMTASLKNDIGKDGKQSEIGERAAMEEFWRIGIFSKTRTRDLMSIGQGGSAYSLETEKYMEMAGYIFHKTEEMNRAVTALAAYRLARKKFSSNKNWSASRQHDEAVLLAEELVEMSHFDYTNTNRPRFMQGDKGRVVFLFRNYSLNMTYRLIRDFRDGIWRNKNIPKAERDKARTRFLGMIGMTTIFAGMAGWPMMSAVEVIANNLLSDDDDDEGVHFDFLGDPNRPFDSKARLRRLLHDATEEHIAQGWGQKVATAVMKGPWTAFAGTDLSQRASLNNLWIREVPDNLWGNKQDLLLHLMGEFAGPIAGVGFNWGAAWDNAAEGRSFRAWEKVMPKAVGDIIKTIRYATQGAQTYQRDMIVSPEEMSSWDLFVQISGFTPTRLSDRYEQNRAIKDMEQSLRGRRQDLMNSLFMAWRVGDQSEGRAVLQEIIKWNRSNPRYPITSDGIIQSAKNRAAYDLRTVGGVAVDKRLMYLQETMRFTSRPQQ